LYFETKSPFRGRPQGGGLKMKRFFIFLFCATLVFPLGCTRTVVMRPDVVIHGGDRYPSYPSERYERQHTYRVLEYKHPIGSGSDWKGGLAGLSRDEYPAYATRVTERIFQMFSQRVPGRMESGDFNSVQSQVLRQLWEPRKVHIPENGYFFGMSHKNGVTMAPSGHIFRNKTGQTLRGVRVQVDVPGGWRLRALLQNEPGVHTGENCGNVVLTEIWKKAQKAPQTCNTPQKVYCGEEKKTVIPVWVRIAPVYYKAPSPQHRRVYYPPQKRVKAPKSVHKVERYWRWRVNPQPGPRPFRR
jgi:hypothetical protein